MIRHPSTGNYVLWANRLPRDTPTTEAYRRAGFAVGVATNPAGPFVFPTDATDAMPSMDHAGGADFSLLQDGDEAYIAYGSWRPILTPVYSSLLLFPSLLPSLTLCSRSPAR